MTKEVGTVFAHALTAPGPTHRDLHLSTSSLLAQLLLLCPYPQPAWTLPPCPSLPSLPFHAGTLYALPESPAFDNCSPCLPESTGRRGGPSDRFDGMYRVCCSEHREDGVEEGEALACGGERESAPRVRLGGLLVNSRQLIEPSALLASTYRV
ncbi:hypothetical protein C8T65DRAFT_687606 [Cerioporus squamosus]|nr:hypothetical protein C8T65DRAFT_687606 [Cerioporus squamosus]